MLRYGHLYQFYLMQPDIWIEKAPTSEEHSAWPSDIEALAWIESFLDEDCWRKGFINDSDPRLVILSLVQCWDNLQASLEDEDIESLLITAKAVRHSFSAFQDIYEGDAFCQEWKSLGTDHVTVCEYFAIECQLRFCLSLEDPGSKKLATALLSLSSGNMACVNGTNELDFLSDLEIVEKDEFLDTYPLIYRILFPSGSMLYLLPLNILSDDLSRLKSLFFDLNSSFLTTEQLEALFSHIYIKDCQHASEASRSEALDFIQDSEKLLSLMVGAEISSDSDMLEEDHDPVFEDPSSPSVESVLAAHGICSETMIFDITSIEAI